MLFLFMHPAAVVDLDPDPPFYIFFAELEIPTRALTPDGCPDPILSGGAYSTESGYPLFNRKWWMTFPIVNIICRNVIYHYLCHTIYFSFCCFSCD